MSFDGRRPSEFVTYLLDPGLVTSAGHVPLQAYVSGASRSPRAAAALACLNSLMAGFSNSDADLTLDEGVRRPRTYRGSRYFRDPLPGTPAEFALNELEALQRQVRDRVGSGSGWRRVFTGQGVPESITDVMNFIVEHASTLAHLRMGREGTSVFAQYFLNEDGTLITPDQSRDALLRMVDDEIFGYDCIGFVGNYLRWCGLFENYPEYDIPQYARLLRFNPISSLTQIEERCVLLWLEDIGTRHIAIVDRVESSSASSARVTICQSSGIGPQTNEHVSLSPMSDRCGLGDEPLNGAACFRLSGGTPRCPVTGKIVIGKRAAW
jgi:hypothetical protein